MTKEELRIARSRVAIYEALGKIEGLTVLETLRVLASTSAKICGAVAEGSESEAKKYQDVYIKMLTLEFILDEQKITKL